MAKKKSKKLIAKKKISKKKRPPIAKKRKAVRRPKPTKPEIAAIKKKEKKKRILQLFESGMSITHVRRKEKLTKAALVRILSDTNALKKQYKKEHLQQYQINLDKMITLAKILNRIPDLKTIFRLNISQNAAFKIQKELFKLGFHREYQIKNKATIPMLLAELKRLQRTLKKIPSHIDIRKHSRYSVRFYHQNFPSITVARKMAGIKNFK